MITWSLLVHHARVQCHLHIFDRILQLLTPFYSFPYPIPYLRTLKKALFSINLHTAVPFAHLMSSYYVPLASAFFPILYRVWYQTVESLLESTGRSASLDSFSVVLRTTFLAPKFRLCILLLLLYIFIFFLQSIAYKYMLLVYVYNYLNVFISILSIYFVGILFILYIYIYIIFLLEDILWLHPFCISMVAR